MQTVTHDGRTTAYRVEDRGGDGAPVLCVHGSGGTHAVWKSQLARLSRERPIAALDLSGHGDSDDVDTEPGPETLDAYVADVRAVADEVGASVLVGNSLGGAVVLTAVLDGGFDADALVLPGSGAKLAVLDELRGWLAGEDGGFARAVEFLHREDMLFRDPSERELEFSKEAMREAGRGVVERDFLSCDDFDVRDRLGEIEAPTLALTGEHDRLTPPEYHEYVAEHVQDGAWTTLPNAAHLSMLEAPDAFNGAVSGFLDERGL
ncbi:alpha/beta hydrolase [Halobacterium sp. R2-5]|uniref:alpha/beta fold hydrolase n=1 Tax=Halobacterium sp. R2-5 TaxID=2715751 RepID=UPI0014235FBB|nr:alpha/beta hydrolase [Halobacterium sp. R2-5]NIC00355.1 alpha/beta hydrolase [Halobacterium sp. R2-5]